jgi:hypothetical protein
LSQAIKLSLAVGRKCEQSWKSTHASLGQSLGGSASAFHTARLPSACVAFRPRSVGLSGSLGNSWMLPPKPRPSNDATLTRERAVDFARNIRHESPGVSFSCRDPGVPTVRIPAQWICPRLPKNPWHSHVSSAGCDAGRGHGPVPVILNPCPEHHIVRYRAAMRTNPWHSPL